VTALTEQQRAAIAALLGDAKPATDSLLLSVAEQIRDRREHDHESAGPDWDWYCLNASGWLGDKAPTVLRRLLEAEARVAALETAAAADLTVYRASHDSIVIGHYRTAQVAREHCTAYAKQEHTAGTEQQLWWREDEDTVDLQDEGVAELIERIGSGPVTPTGYLVTPVVAAAAFVPGGAS
jgi:hypothetical protein